MFMIEGHFPKVSEKVKPRWVQKTKIKHSAGLLSTLSKSSFHAKSLHWKLLNVLTTVWSVSTEGHVTTMRHLFVPCPVLWHLTKEKHIVMIHRVWLHLSSFRTCVKQLGMGDTAKTVSAFWWFNKYIDSEHICSKTSYEWFLFIFFDIFDSTAIVFKHMQHV